MQAKAQQEKTVTTVLIDRWEQVFQKLEQIAGEFPEEKLEWRPKAGIRSIGEVIRHLAFWNHYLADSLRGKQPDGNLNELPLADYPTKEKVLEALKSSANEVSVALCEQPAAVNPKTAELVLSFIEHTSEHYGQLAVYARFLDIVPPASRG